MTLANWQFRKPEVCELYPAANGGRAVIPQSTETRFRKPVQSSWDTTNNSYFGDISPTFRAQHIHKILDSRSPGGPLTQVVLRQNRTLNPRVAADFESGSASSPELSLSQSLAAVTENLKMRFVV